MKIGAQNAAYESCSHCGFGAYDGYFVITSPSQSVQGISGADQDRRAPVGPVSSPNALVHLGQFRLLIGHGLA